MPRIDRIAEPWGTRTPYGPGETWPTREDSHLADGLTEDDVDRWVQSATILHSNGDGLDIAVKDDRIVGVRGRAVDRVNHGRLGPKDLFGWQANNSADRLKRPLIRRDGELVECDWDTAMDAVAGRCRELPDERGPSSIAFYTTGGSPPPTPTSTPPTSSGSSGTTWPRPRPCCGPGCWTGCTGPTVP